MTNVNCRVVACGAARKEGQLPLEFKEKQNDGSREACFDLMFLCRVELVLSVSVSNIVDDNIVGN